MSCSLFLSLLSPLLLKRKKKKKVNYTLKENKSTRFLLHLESEYQEGDSMLEIVRQLLQAFSK